MAIKRGEVSGKIDAYLKDNVGQVFQVGQLWQHLNFDESRQHAASQKILKLARDNKIERIDKGTYKVLPAILNGKKKKNGTAHPAQASLPIPTLTPAGFQNLEKMQFARDAQPLDLGGIMQQVIAVDEQNKIYRNALEQIMVILEQAGLMEKVDHQ